MEPAYAEYVGAAFNPVALMLDFWRNRVAAGEKREVPVYVINDRSRSWRGTVAVRGVEGEQSRAVEVPGYGRQIVVFAVTFPSKPGEYRLEASLRDGRKTIRSLRDYKVAAKGQ